MPVILATWEAEIKRIKFRGQPVQIVGETQISKITRAKWTGGMAQAVEHLLCKHKILQKTRQNKNASELSCHCHTILFLIIWAHTQVGAISYPPVQWAP
jgi:hypothetical protein